MIERIKLGNQEIILVGTAHVSKKSVELVEQTIKKEKPDVVAVELDEKRYAALKDPDRWKNMEMSQVIKEGKAYMFLSNLVLANFQKKIGKKLGVQPGAEMLAAINAAGKARVEFVDREIQITLKRAFRKMGFIEKVKVIVSLFGDTFAAEVDEELVEKLKEKDIVTEAINELANHAPSVKEVLVDERDSYIAGKLARLKGKKIVAVLGAGHIAGVKKKITQTIDLQKLDEIPKKFSFAKYVGYLIPLLLAGLIGYGILKGGLNQGLELFGYWFLINGVLAALGTAIALGHPASILAAFFAAPFTSLNPAIAAGWVAGYVETKVRNPRVKDFEALSELSSIGDFWKNQVTRVLLVVVFANIGSSIGTFVALPYILSLVG